MGVTRVAIAVVEQGNSVLVGVRPASVPLPGMHEFPGGKVRNGETPAEAACRECEEETGLATEEIEPLRVVDHHYAHGDLQLHFFRCRAVGTATPREPFRWVPRDKLAELEFPPANADVIAALACQQS